MIKNLFILALFAASSLVINAQELSPDSMFVRYFYPNGELSSEGVMKHGKPDGYWKAYHPNGMIKSEGLRVNSLLDSIWNFYNSSGAITQSISYKLGKKNGYSLRYRYDNPEKPGEATIVARELFVNGQKEGQSYYYYPTGDLRQIVVYRNNKRHGLVREYNRDSVLITVMEYNEDYLVERERVNRVDAQGRKQGSYREYNEDGRLILDEQYLDGELHGYSRTFNKQGELLAVVRYERGAVMEEIDEDLRELLDMKSSFDEQGRLLFRGAFREGTPVGVHRYYDTTGAVENAKLYNEAGILLSEGIINEAGQRMGSWTDFYPGGEIRAKGQYDADRRIGSWTFFFINGKLEQKGRYERGRLHGLWIWYYENGATWREESYFNGREDGLFTEYDAEGKILAQGNYIGGEKDGEWFYRVGDHTEKGSYVIGLREGIWQYFYAGGALKYEGNYSQGNPDKRHKYYYENGILKEEQYYSMGIREKTWKKYDEEGNLSMTISYRNNVEQRINGIRIKLPESNVTLIR